MNLGQYDWSAVLGNIGKVATVFNPAIGGGLIVASQVVSRFEGDDILSNDDVLEHNVIGLTRCSEILDDMLLNGSFDAEKLKFISENLKGLGLVFSKISKLLK